MTSLGSGPWKVGSERCYHPLKCVINFLGRSCTVAPKGKKFCANGSDFGLQRLEDKIYSVEDCQKICENNDECQSFTVLDDPNNGPGGRCTTFREGCEDDYTQDPLPNFYDLENCKYGKI